MRVAFVSTYPPRRCGIATFTADLIGAVREADSGTQARVAAIDERNSVRAYGSEVRWRIKQGSALPYRAAAREIDRSNAEIVCVQHEFGLYGLWKGGGFVGDHWIEGMYEDHLTPFLEELKKPALVNMHTVLPDPSPAIREAVRAIAETAHGLVVMAETAVDILDRDYGIKERPLVIPHGMPHIEPKGRRRLKAKLGLDGRTIVSTFGLVGPGKGLEYAIEAMPAVAARHPEALYLIAGQTHPELLKQRGEEYRNRLQSLVDELELTDHVSFVNQYLDQKDIIEYLLATDVYVTPYLDPNQITSGTLSYALGAGQGRGVDPVPARAGGAGEGPRHPGRVPLGRDRSPRRSTPSWTTPSARRAWRRTPTRTRTRRRGPRPAPGSCPRCRSWSTSTSPRPRRARTTRRRCRSPTDSSPTR